MSRKRIGELLLERGAIDDHQLQSALSYQRDHGGRIGAALVAKGYLTEEHLVSVLGTELNLPVIDIPDRVDAAALKLLKVKFCEDHDVFPIHLEDARTTGRRTLTLALADPLDIPTIEEVEFVTGCRVQPALATTSQIRVGILRHYYRQNIDPRRAGGRMTVVRPGGMEEDIDTNEPSFAGARPSLKVPARPTMRPASPPARLVSPRPPAPRLGDDDDEPVMPLTEEVTSRTEVAELIRERERRAGVPGRAGADLQFLTGTSDAERLEALERKFWALMRIIASKGMITKEEFLAEFDR